jgi:AcrR family transcriptional regulator
VARLAVPAARSPRADRRPEIVAVAYRLIAERGLEGLRFADVARDAGINNGTLLYYFAGKDALIQAVGAFLVELYSQPPPPGAPDVAHSALAELRWEFEDARSHLRDTASVVHTELVARAQRDPAVAALVADIDAHWRGWLTRILERGRAQGVFRSDIDSGLVATTIVTSIRGAGMQALITGTPHTAEPAMAAVGALIENWIVSERNDS